MRNLLLSANPMMDWTTNSVNLAIALVVDLIAAVCIASYLLYSFGVLQYATARKEKNRFLAFIPVAQLAYFAFLAEKQNRKAKKYTPLFSFSLIAISGCFISLCLFFINRRFPMIASTVTSILVFGSLFIAFLIFGLVVQYLSAAVLWRWADPEQFTLTMILSIVLGVSFAPYVYRAGLMVMKPISLPPAEAKPVFAAAEPRVAEEANDVLQKETEPQQPASKKKFIVHLPDEEEE